MSDKKQVRIRKANPDDIVNIVKCLRHGWNDKTIEYAPIDDLRGYGWILSILQEGMIAVADLSGRIVGAACASPYRQPWSLQWMLDMEFLYVLPNFRGEGVAEGLMRAVEGFADQYKLPLTFGMQTVDRPVVKDRMMKMAGWVYAGGNYVRPARHGQEQEQDNLEAEAGVPPT